MNFDKVSFSSDSAVAKIRLNTPENFNSMNHELLDELLAALELCKDNAIKAVVLSGAGKAFCAGGDIKFMKKCLDNGKISDFFPVVDKAGKAAKAIRALNKPVIAAVQGSAAGAGSNLAFVCDFIIAEENARFLESYINIALVPDNGGSQVLRSRVTLGKMNEMLFLGQPLTANEALEMGAINAVVKKEDMDNEVQKLLDQLVSLPPVAAGKIKAMINKRAYANFDEMIDMEYEYMTDCLQTKDFAEGILAFLQKRKPEFRGF